MTEKTALESLRSQSCIFILSWLLLKYSAKVPIRKIFSISSILMAVLAVILTGKGFHALQETGVLSVTTAWLKIKWDLLGLYPTFETTLPQVVVLALVFILWFYGKRSPTKVIKE